MFGNAAKQYAVGRMGFPNETFDAIFDTVATPLVNALDIGCGTGIATRQLASRCSSVIGCDPDEAMLAEARAKPIDNIRYVAGSAENLPMANGSVGLVTAFSAFHWFDTKKAYDEIVRVCGGQGWLAIVNKTELGSFETGFRDALQPHAGVVLPTAKKGYDPLNSLSNFGSKSLRTHSIEVSEKYNIDRAINFIRSQSLWNLIGEEHFPAAWASACHWVGRKIEENGAFVRHVRVDTVLGRVG